MDNERKSNSSSVEDVITSYMSYNDLHLLKSRIVEMCKLFDISFVDADSERIRQNINMVFSTGYTLEEVNYVIGLMYEEQFYYKNKQEL